MPLDTLRGATRRLDLATFTGDAWAAVATLDVPPADVPRLIATASVPVRWSVVAMDGGADDAQQVADSVTSLEAVLVKISRTTGGSTLVVPVTSTSGTIANLDLTDDGISPSECFVLAVRSVTTGGGSAPWLWVECRSGAEVAGAGVVP